MSDKKIGRPVEWTKERIDQKCTEIFLLMETEGLSIRKILQRSDMPSNKEFCRWIKKNEDLSKHYARAREERAEFIFDEILEIADNSNADAWIDDAGQTKIDGEAIQRSKLKIDARKWMLGKMQPKKYGDKMDVTSGGEAIKNNVSAIQVQFVDFSEDNEDKAE